MSGATEKEAWHLDKKVPLALIITIAAQTFAAVWWAAGMTARVEQHDREIRTLAGNDAQMQGEARRIAEHLARMDERLAAQTELLRRLDAALNRPPQR